MRMKHEERLGRVHRSDGRVAWLGKLHHLLGLEEVGTPDEPPCRRVPPQGQKFRNRSASRAPPPGHFNDFKALITKKTSRARSGQASEPQTGGQRQSGSVDLDSQHMEPLVLA